MHLIAVVSSYYLDQEISYTKQFFFNYLLISMLIHILLLHFSKVAYLRNVFKIKQCLS